MNILVVGEKQSGKTSFIQNLSQRQERIVSLSNGYSVHSMTSTLYNTKYCYKSFTEINYNCIEINSLQLEKLLNEEKEVQFTFKHKEASKTIYLYQIDYIILCYNTNIMNAYENVKLFYEMLSRHFFNMIILVGTHIDLPRAIRQDRVIFHKELNILYYEFDSRLPTIHRKQPLQFIARKLYKSMVIYLDPYE